MVLDVARALELLQVVLALEFREQRRRRLAEHVDQHVQPAAMRHAEDDVFHALRAAGLDDVLEQRDQAVAALERKALLRRVARREIALEALRHRQVPQDVPALVHRKRLAHAADLEVLLQPQALGLVRHVRELGADRAAVDVPELGDDLAQLEPRLDRLVAAAGQELGVEVGLAQPEVIESQHLRDRSNRETERVDAGDQVAAVGIDLDQPGDRALLGRDGIAGSGARRGRTAGRPRHDEGSTRQPWRGGRAPRPGAHAQRRSPPDPGWRSIRATAGRSTRAARGSARTSPRRRHRCRPPGAWPAASVWVRSSCRDVRSGGRAGSLASQNGCVV